MPSPDEAPTEAFYAPTRPLEALPGPDAGGVAGQAPASAGGLTCSRCRQPTGNDNQGHYWKWCKLTRRYGRFHFCCPGNCETRQGEP